MNLENANRATRAVLEEPLDAISSYFSGQTEKDWHTGIPHYARVHYTNVYPGIDLIYYANNGNLEHDFRLQPNADPGQIRLAYNQPISTDVNGDLLIGGLRQKRPKVYQNGQEIACDYLVRDPHHVQLALADYDRSEPLTVDPELVFSTFLGGPGADGVSGIALDSSGFIYLAMDTQSPAGPILDPFQQEAIAVLQPAVFKFTPDGQKIVFYAVLNSGAWDAALGIAVDSNDNVIVVGQTESARFPLKNAIQSVNNASFWTAFITKLTADGRSLVYSTYYGGSNTDSMAGVVVDAQGNAFFGGDTFSRDIPIKNAVQPRSGGGSSNCFVGELSPSGELMFSTYFGGSGRDFCSSPIFAHDGGLLVGGDSNSSDFPLKNPIQTELSPRTNYGTPFLFKLSGDGQTLIFSTFFGGPTAGGGAPAATDGEGNIYVVGSVGDNNFTVKNGYQSSFPGTWAGFWAKYDSNMQTLLYSTYFGGSDGLGSSIQYLALDSNGNVYVAGITASSDFPHKHSLQKFRGIGFNSEDGFLAKFDPSGSTLVYSTFLGGGWISGIALDPKGNVFLAGSTLIPGFPVKNAFQPTYGGGGDGILLEISDNTPVESSPIKVTPGSVTFQYVQGSVKPQLQTIAVTGPSFNISLSDKWFYAEQPALGTITVQVFPDGLKPGTYNGTVSLTPQTGDPATISVTLTVLAVAPVLTSIAPSVITIGSGDTTITLHGSGFSSQASILLGGTAWQQTPVVFVDSGTLKLTLPKILLTAQSTLPFSLQNPQSAISNVLSVTIGQPGPQVTTAGVVNAASFTAGPVAPGEIVSIFGTNLDKNVTFDGTPATIVFFSSKQIDVTVPYAITGQTNTQLVVGQYGVSAATVTLNVSPSAPGIFAAVPVGNNIVTLYATGCGSLSATNLIQLPVSVTANGKPTQVLYAGIAPGEPEGVDQINIQLPDGMSGPVGIILKAGAAQSQPFKMNEP